MTYSKAMREATDAKEENRSFPVLYGGMSAAEKALEDLKITQAVAKETLVCDVYCCPPHTHQTFYTKLYRQNNAYILLYAKFTCNAYAYNDAFLRNLRKSDFMNRNDQDSGIICGIKRIEKNDPLILRLLSCLPHTDEQSVKPMIDGVLTVIRNYKEKRTATLAFCDMTNIFRNSYTDEQKAFLQDLFLHFEEIIGRVSDYD